MKDSIKRKIKMCADCDHAEKTDIDGLVCCKFDRRTKDDDMNCGMYSPKGGEAD